MATRLAHIREATFQRELAVPNADSLYLSLKRLLDIVLASVLLLLLAPVMVCIAIAIVLDSPGPIIFRQKRVLGGWPEDEEDPQEQAFAFFKFRSMYHNSDEGLHRRYVERLISGRADCVEDSGRKLYKLGRDPRITRVGRFLRKSSLDELPQLVNILRGEMSFVGPRPAIPYEVVQYKAWHLQRLTVMQGLTGLWQVMGRSELSFDEMVQLDIEYARRRSFWLDLQIIFATIPAVLRGRGVR